MFHLPSPVKHHRSSTDLVNGDAQTILDPTYTIPGQYCIEQTQPLPATILGVIPNITVGDGGRK
jgi:hypothetical protein